MAFKPLNIFSKIWSAIANPPGFIQSKMFNALKKPIYKLAYQAGVRISELGNFLKQQGVKNMPANFTSDVDNYYRQLKNAEPLGKLEKEAKIPFNLITKEKMRRKRHYRYIVEGNKFDFGTNDMIYGTYSFYTNELVSLAELQQQANERRMTIDKYGGNVQAYDLHSIIAVVENQDWKPTKQQ